MTTPPDQRTVPVPPWLGPAVAQLFARQPERMVPDLDRITTLVQLLGRPDQASPAIRVTGTNGKTTTTAMIAGLLGALGLTAGSYTSPHLQDVAERIRVAGEPISPTALADRIAELEPYLAEVDARHPERVSFFEALTALAFVHFADTPVDVAVLEVGMGGAWDATNVARGEVAVLGRVALDHAELGADVGSVAREKAGVIQPGAAVVSAAQEPEALDVIRTATERADGHLVLAGRDFDVPRRRLALGGQELDIRGVTGDVPAVYLPLHGPHQAANAACALAAVEGFLGFAGGLDPELVREAFAAVRVPGRLEVVRRAPDSATVILDGAHNPAGARATAGALRTEFAVRHRIMVLGVLQDKDVEGIVSALAEVADHVVATSPTTPRAADADRVAEAVEAAGTSSEVAGDPAEAIDRALGLATSEDAVVVAGSLYLVGEVRTLLGLAPQ